jgi:hypothetical protein
MIDITIVRYSDSVIEIDSNLSDDDGRLDLVLAAGLWSIHLDVVS